MQPYREYFISVCHLGRAQSLFALQTALFQTQLYPGNAPSHSTAQHINFQCAVAAVASVASVTS